MPGHVLKLEIKATDVPQAGEGWRIEGDDPRLGDDLCPHAEGTADLRIDAQGAVLTLRPLLKPDEHDAGIGLRPAGEHIEADDVHDEANPRILLQGRRQLRHGFRRAVQRRAFGKRHGNDIIPLIFRRYEGGRHKPIEDAGQDDDGQKDNRGDLRMADEPRNAA